MSDIKIYAFADEASPMLDEQIEAMKRNRLDGLEIRGVDSINVSDLSIEQAREVRKKLDNAGLITWSVGSPIGKIHIETDDFMAHTEKFKHTLEIASILGAENIRIFSFYLPEDKRADDYKNEVIDRLGTFAELAAGSGVTLCHENEKKIYGDVASRCVDIHQAIPTIMGIFDPANFVQSGQKTLAAWQLLKPYIKYIHIKDSLRDSSVVPAGKGNGNIGEIVADYLAAGGGMFTVEPHLAVFDGLAELERKDDESKVGQKYVYANNAEAFDAAIMAFKTVLKIASPAGGW